MTPEELYSHVRAMLREARYGRRSAAEVVTTAVPRRTPPRGRIDRRRVRGPELIPGLPGSTVHRGSYLPGDGGGGGGGTPSIVPPSETPGGPGYHGGTQRPIIQVPWDPPGEEAPIPPPNTGTHPPGNRPPGGGWPGSPERPIIVPPADTPDAPLPPGGGIPLPRPTPPTGGDYPGTPQHGIDIAQWGMPGPGVRGGAGAASLSVGALRTIDQVWRRGWIGTDGSGPVARLPYAFDDLFRNRLIEPAWYIESGTWQETATGLSGAGALMLGDDLDEVEARLTLAAGVVGHDRGAIIRGTHDPIHGLSGYVAVHDDTDTRLYRFDAGTPSLLATIPAVGNTLTLGAAGSTIYVSVAGLVAQVTDATYASGRAGIYAADISGFTRFSLREIGGAPPIPAVLADVIGVAPGCVGGEATDSSNNAHYEERVSPPGYPDLLGFRVNAAAGNQQWLTFSSAVGVKWAEPAFSLCMWFVPAAMPGGGALEPGDVLIDTRDAGGNFKFSVYFRGLTKSLEILDSGFNAVAGSQSPALTAGALYWVQVEATNGTNADVTLRILDEDLQEVFAHTASGVNVGTGDYADCRIGKLSNFNATTYDVYFGAVFGRGARIEAGWTATPKRICANGDTMQWTPSTGDVEDAWQLVRDVPYTPSTYVASSTADEVAEFRIETNAAAGITATRGVLAVRFIGRITAPTGTGKVRSRLTSSGTTEEAADQALQALDEALGLTLDRDPATGDRWQPSALDAITIGYRNAAHVESRMLDGTLICITYE